MSTIQKTFETSLKRVCRTNLFGVRSGPQKNWHWALKNETKRDVIFTLKLILSWVLGSQVLKMTNAQVLYHTIEQYKKCDYPGFLSLKYGENQC